jgi:hypothetical protein
MRSAVWDAIYLSLRKVAGPESGHVAGQSGGGRAERRGAGGGILTTLLRETRAISPGSGEDFARRHHEAPGISAPDGRKKPAGTASCEVTGALPRDNERAPVRSGLRDVSARGVGCGPNVEE